MINLMFYLFIWMVLIIFTLHVSFEHLLELHLRFLTHYFRVVIEVVKLKFILH